jgi:predicted permease
LNVTPWLDSVRSDAVFGWRQLMKKKATTAAAVLSLGLAIGASLAAFRLIDGLLLRPLPVAGVDRLSSVAFSATGADGKSMVYDSCSYPMFRRMREAVKGQAELVAVSYADRTDLTFGSDEEMEQAYRQYVSVWMFSSFGLRPELGRLLDASDDGPPGTRPVAVISHDYWARRFGGDRGVIGRRFRMGDDLLEIVGVAAEPFTGTETGTVTDVFLPMAMKIRKTLESSNNFWLRTLVELKPGIGADPVRDRLRVVFRAIQQERAKTFVGMPKQRLDAFFKETLLLEPAAAGRSNLQRDYDRALVALGILVGMVLLIACANVANLMTARAAARGREMALRISIGAARWRLVQMVVIESAWIAVLGTASGGMFAWRAAPWLVDMLRPAGDPARLALTADWRLLAFALATECAVTLLFGLTPALRASSVKPSSALKGGDNPHSRRRLMRVLIAAQVAFCFIVLLVAGLFVTTFDRLSHQPTGFSAERVVNLETVARRPQPPVFWEQALDHLRSAPGVESAALTIWPLMSGESAISNVSTNGAAPSEVYCDFLYISPGFLDTMKIPMLDGRDFRAGDADGVAIVNQAFARQYWNGENPVGRWFDRVAQAGTQTRIQIVGLVSDARSRDDQRLAIRPTAYVPFDAGASSGRARGTFVVRTRSANPLALASGLRREVPRARAEFRVNNVRAQTEIDGAHMIRERLLAMLALFFAGSALLLAGIGLYGVLDYSVVERRREIGIRMAIGARAGDIALRVTVDTFAMLAAGAVAGLAIGLASVRSIESLLYQVKATDLAVIAMPAAGLALVALAAALAPTLRAVRIDPVTILRSE